MMRNYVIAQTVIVAVIVAIVVIISKNANIDISLDAVMAFVK